MESVTTTELASYGVGFLWLLYSSIGLQAHLQSEINYSRVLMVETSAAMRMLPTAK